MDPRALLTAGLAVLGFAFVAFWVTAARRRGATRAALPDAMRAGTGFLTDFLDTLGIGSFATTTTIFRLRRLVADEHIPGTLNAGHTLPTIAQALIYITIVEVDFQTLVLLILAAVAGSWFGAAFVAELPRAALQRGMGIALLAAAALMVLTALDRFPGGGNALELSGARLAAGFAINVVLGALMTLGIGLYAPCMIMVSLLGMNPTAAFPIMMGSCAFLMPIASAQFIRRGKYDLRAAAGLAIGGIPGVLIAAFIVGSLPLTYIRWLVVVIVLYAAVTLLVASRRESRAPRVGAATT